MRLRFRTCNFEVGNHSSGSVSELSAILDVFLGSLVSCTASNSGRSCICKSVLCPNPDARSGNPKPIPGSNAANHRAELMSCSFFVQSESCLPVERPVVEVVVVVVVLSTGHDYELSGTLGQTLGP